MQGEVVDTQWLDGERLKARVRFEDLSKQDGLYLREYIAYLIEQRDRISS